MILPLSRVPFFVLYRVSDVLFFALYFLVPYRKKVVLENLRGCFPEKSEAEIRRVCRGFYRHFADLILESVKGFSITPNELLERHRYTNVEVLDQYFARGRSVVLIGSHYANWEWGALSVPPLTRLAMFAIYQPLSQRFMNEKIKSSRQRLGMKLVSNRALGAAIQRCQGKPFGMAYLGDQSPTRISRKRWLRFLGRDTAALTGFEHFAREYDSPVLYWDIQKESRGHYSVTFRVLAENPRELREGEIVERYFAMLEGIVRARPEHWLWSHRRWKLARETGDSRALENRAPVNPSFEK